MSGPPPPALPTANDWTLGNLAEFTVDTFTSHPNNASRPAIYDISTTLKLAVANTSTTNDLTEISMWLIDTTTPLSPTIGSRFTWTGTSPPSGGATNNIYSLPAGFAVNGNGAYLYNVSGNTPVAFSGTFQISHFTFSGTTISYASSQTVPNAMRAFPIGLLSLSDDMLCAYWDTDTGTGFQDKRQYSLVSTSGGTLGSIPSPTATGVLGDNMNPGPVLPSSLGTSGRTVFWLAGNNFQVMLHDGTLTSSSTLSVAGFPSLSGVSSIFWSVPNTADTFWMLAEVGGGTWPGALWQILEVDLDAATGAASLAGDWDAQIPASAPSFGTIIASLAPVTQSVHVPYFPTIPAANLHLQTVPYEEASHTVASAWLPIIDQLHSPGGSALGCRYGEPPGVGPNGMLSPSLNLCQWGDLVALVGYWGTTGSGAIIVADALFVEVFALSIDLSTDAWIPFAGQVNSPGAVDRAWAWSVGQVLTNVPQNPEIL